MTTQVFKNVSPILAGYDSKIRIKFSQQAWDYLSLGSGRLVSHFRVEIDAEEVLFQADTLTGTIEQGDDNTITITLPGSETADWEHRSVVFDLIRIVETAKTAVPGIWRWPVRQRVTRNVQ